MGQEMLLTAGGKDDIYLPENQLEAKQWLERNGMRVMFKMYEELNHGDHNKDEMSLILNACVHAFLEADTRPAWPPGEDSAAGALKKAALKRKTTTRIWVGAAKAPKRRK